MLVGYFQILTGNINTYSEVENVLQPMILASKIRIFPYSQYDRTVCLRAEIVGCIWDGECFCSELFCFAGFLIVFNCLLVIFFLETIE